MEIRKHLPGWLGGIGKKGSGDSEDPKKTKGTGRKITEKGNYFPVTVDAETDKRGLMILHFGEQRRFIANEGDAKRYGIKAGPYGSSKLKVYPHHYKFAREHGYVRDGVDGKVEVSDIFAADILHKQTARKYLRKPAEKEKTQSADGEEGIGLLEAAAADGVAEEFNIDDPFGDGRGSALQGEIPNLADSDRSDALEDK